MALIVINEAQRLSAAANSLIAADSTIWPGASAWRENRNMIALILTSTRTVDYYYSVVRAEKPGSRKRNRASYHPTGGNMKPMRVAGNEWRYEMSPSEPTDVTPSLKSPLE